MKSEWLLELPSPVSGPDGTYWARAYGRPRPDGLWEGWIEFVRDDGAAKLRTARETTQPNRTDLVYWCTGLTPVYLEGALKRAILLSADMDDAGAAPMSWP